MEYSKERMIIDVLLKELKKIKKSLIRAGGISSEKTVQHYLDPLASDITETIEATELELEKDKEENK